MKRDKQIETTEAVNRLMARIIADEGLRLTIVYVEISGKLLDFMVRRNFTTWGEGTSTQVKVTFPRNATSRVILTKIKGALWDAAREIDTKEAIFHAEIGKKVLDAMGYFCTQG